jgi:hypothetical protein
MPDGHKTRVLTAMPAAKGLAEGVYAVPKTKQRKPRALMKFHAAWTPTGFTVDVPIHTETESNANGLWRARHGKAKAQRALTVMVLNMLHNPEAKHRIRTLRFVRFAPGELDCDNLPGALKHVRDQVCAWIAGENTITGQGDDSPSCGIRFEYAQCKQKAYGVRCEMTFGGRP